MSEKEFQFINIEYLTEMVGEEMVDPMLELFENYIQENINDMKNSLSEQNWQELAKIAHRTRSTVSSVGMQKTFEKLYSLENLAKQAKETETFENLLSLVIEDCEKALIEIKIFKNK